MEPRANHWKVTAIGMALVILLAIATGLVVARWYGPEISRFGTPTSELPAGTPVAELPPRPERVTQVSSSVASPSASPATEAETAPAASESARMSSVPPTQVTEACNEQAARESGTKTTTKDKTVDLVKDGAIAGAGPAYGIDPSRQDDTTYRAAYSSCLRDRGYSG